MAWDVLYFGCFEAWDVLRLGRFEVGTFCSWDVMSGYFVFGTFCSLDVMSLGRFVCAPFF